MVGDQIRTNKVLMTAFSHAPDDRRIIREATALTQINWLVSIIYPANNSSKIFTYNNINFIPVPLGRMKNSPLRFLLFWLSAVQLDPRPFQVIHCHDLNCLPLGWFWSKKFNLPLIYDSHEWGVGVYDLHNSVIKRNIWNFLEIFLIKQASVVITVNIYLARMLRRYRKLSKLPEVVKNASELNTPTSSSKKLQGNIGYLGGLMKGRNLSAILSVLVSMPQVKLHLIGDGKMKKEILSAAEKLNVANQVLISGWVDDIRAALLPVEIGLSLIPSNCTNNRLSSAGKVFDYAALMIPQISSNHPALRDLVQERGIGICIDEQDPSMLVDAVSTLLKNQKQYKQIVLNIKKNINFYLWENEKKKLWKIYRNINKG